MMIRARFYLAVAVAAFALVNSGCSRLATNGLAAHAAHELRIGLISDPRSLNGLFVTSQSDVDLAQLTTETLVGLSPANKLIPLLSDPVPTLQNGGISRDGLTITYHLRKNARFADGQPVTSKDVAFTYRVILDPRNPVTDTAPYRRIAALEAPDPHTVRIRLKRPWVAAVSELFAVSDFIYGILPAHAFANTDLSRAGWNELPFGSGPFRVLYWHHGDEIALAPNPYAWRKPRLARLVLKILPNQTTLLVALRTHEIDEAGLTEEQIALVRPIAGLQVTQTPQNHTIYIEFQMQRAPMDDPLVRRALVEAIDAEQIRTSVFLNLQPIAGTEIPPIFSAHDASIAHRPYDPARAAADLDRAGWHLRDTQRYNGNRPLSLLFAYVSTSDQARRLATVVQENLSRVGVTIAVKGYPPTQFYGSASGGGIERGGNYDLAFTDWYGGADPEASEMFTCAQRAPDGPNSSRWCDQRYDRLFAKQAVTFDERLRRRLFFAIQHVVYDAMPGDFLVSTRGYTATDLRVRGWSPNMIFNYGSNQDWDFLP